MAEGNRSEAGGRPAIEWVVGFVSAALVSCIIAFLSYEALFGGATPPDLAVSIDRVDRMRNGTLVEVIVRNDGDRTAAGVVAQVVTTGAAGQRIRKAIRFDYVPGHATRRGAFLLDDAGISPADLQLSIDGFTEP